MDPHRVFERRRGRQWRMISAKGMFPRRMSNCALAALCCGLSTQYSNMTRPPWASLELRVSRDGGRKTSAMGGRTSRRNVVGNSGASRPL